MNSARTRWMILLATSASLLSACGKVGQRESSSSSHWLRCETLEECPAELGAAACSLEGYCVDAAGERIEAAGAQSLDEELASLAITLGAQGQGDGSVSQAAESVLSVYCSDCHGQSAEGVALSGGGTDVSDLDDMVGAGWVVPFDPDGSLLMQRLLDGSMPPAGAAPLRGPGLAEVLRDLIELNAFGVGSPSCAVSGLSFDAALASIATDLAEAPAAARPFLRYVSVPGAPGSPGDCAADGGLAQLLNSLSTAASLYEPVRLAGAPTLLRIDLRELGWHTPVTRAGGTAPTVFADAWEALQAANAYAVPFTGPEAEAITRDSGTRYPLIQLDALLAAASDAWTYYAVLGIPADLDTLYQSLGVRAGERATFPGASRAGTSRGMLPGKHALLERRPRADGGHFWQAFYAAPDATGASPATRPFSFASEETHVLFSLPNGMLAWALAGPEGNTLAASTLTYPNEALDLYSKGGFARDGGFDVESPLACYLSCHQPGGVRPVADEVRPSLEQGPTLYEPAVLEQLRGLYPGQTELADLLIEDLGRYRATERTLRLRSNTPNPLAERLLLTSAPVINVNEAAELLGATREAAAQALGIDLVNTVETDRASFRSAFAALLCGNGEGARNRPTDDFCTAAP